MKASSFGILGLALILAAPAGAQTLAAGTWTGSLNLSNGPTIQVQFIVQGEGDAMEIVMKAVDGPPRPVTDLELSDDELKFTWGAFNCTLERKGDKQFEGECGGAAEGQLSLAAPSATEDSATDNILTGEELVATEAATVFDALQRLRRLWLTGRRRVSERGTTSVGVYVGNQRMGDVDFLRTLEPRTVREVRYYTPREATTLFGTDAGGGAIVVTLR
jgi:hypothetical protein